MKLSVIHNNIDLTLKMSDLAAPEKGIDLSQGPLYVGHYKPIKNLYIEMIEGAEEDQLSLQYFNGTDFVGVSNIEDHTYGLTKSGLIRFDELGTSFKESTIGGKKLFWFKLTNQALTTPLIKGISLVLSNDSDLSFVPSLSSYLPNGFDSWIAFHQEATNQVIQMIRNSGKTIRQEKGGSSRHINVKQVDQFDLLDIEEFRNASKYYALYLIFDHISKGDNDSFYQKSARYYEKYLENLNDKLISIDANDNGLTDAGEDLAIQFTRLRRE
jgi:hypothetical protein